MSLSSFVAHPLWLVALIIPLAAAGFYWWYSRRRTSRAIAFGNFSIVGQVASGSYTWVRHTSFASALVALTLVIVALAGPITETQVARNRATVMLVVDVSLSMSATDVAPDRISAAKTAGREFIENLPDDLNIGLVTFAGRARTPVSPTTDHDTVARALGAAELDEATATGDAIMAALDAIRDFSESVPGRAQGQAPATIVLLSDGKQTVPQELDAPTGAFTAAAEAGKAGVPISSISFGSAQGSIRVQGDTIPVPNDDESLREIARISEGAFYSADSLDQLRDVYRDLENEIGYELKRAENPRPFLVAAFIALLVFLATALWAYRTIPD